MKKLLLFAVFFTLMGEASEKSINESWCSEMGGITEYRTLLWYLCRLPH